jgi:DNA-binding response OmpR family regulator
MLSLLLESEGFVTRIAFEGEGAIAIAADFHPDLAVIDIGLPGMNGFEVARRLREMSPNMVLIALSGWQLDNPEREVSVIFNHYLRKPIESRELAALLETV